MLLYLQQICPGIPGSTDLAGDKVGQYLLPHMLQVYCLGKACHAFVQAGYLPVLSSLHKR